jgi:hypothetical protein
LINQNLERQLKSRRLELFYRKKYNISVADENFLKLDELDILLDLKLTGAFEEYLEEGGEYFEEDAQEIFDIMQTEKDGAYKVHSDANKNEMDEYYETML